MATNGPTLTQALQAAVGGDANAAAYLKTQEDTNFAQYMHHLCIELGSKDRAQAVRQLAGLQIKNAVDTRSEAAAQLLHNRWKALPDQARAAIKGMLLQILQDEIKDVRHTAALVIGKIGSIEVPAGTWGDLVPLLDANITKQKQPLNLGLKQASLEALGYLCEEVPEGLESFSNLILMAIATGMDANEKDKDIKLAATTCLVNCIEFIKTNMDAEADRKTIMNMVFSVCGSEDLQVRIAAFSCLVQIANFYYAHLGPFMGTIFNLTTAAIKTQPDEVAQQAIEFWSTVADVELTCQEEDEEAGEDPAHKSRSFNFITAAVGPFVPVLLQALTKQHEDPDDDDWSVSLAAGTCLGLCSQVAKDHIVAHVLPFVQQYVSNDSWRLREAAILSFGCILDGPNKTELEKLVKSAFQMILTRMSDSHALVKDTTAWTIGRICSLLPEVIDPTTLPMLMSVLIKGLNEPPKVASNVAWAIHNLASSVDVDPENPNTSALSLYFHPIVQALLQRSAQPDVKECNLQVSLFEALNIMVQSAAPDVNNLVAAVLPLIMQKLSETLKERASTPEERESLNEIQALLCGTLQAIITKLGVDVIMPQADNLMTLFLSVLATKNATVHEEALMAIGAVADKVEGTFAKYMEYVKPHLFNGLINAQEWRVCNVAVHVTCDITRAVGPQFSAWGDEVMKILLAHLQHPSVEQSVKSNIIACIGDIALAVGGAFDRYMTCVIPMLTQASMLKPDPADDFDAIDYIQSLREAVIEAYSGILLGLSQDNKATVFVSQPGLLQSIMALFDLISGDKHTTERVLRGACGLILDMAKSLGPQIAAGLRTASVQNIILSADHEDHDPETRLNASSARKALS